MGFPPALPKTWIPVENNDFVRPETFIDGEESTDVEVAIYVPSDTRPLDNDDFFPWPGPKTPTVAGEYPVFIRALGGNAPARCIGILVMY